MLKTRSTTLAFAVMLIAAPASANVITDWDATGVALIQGNAPAPPPRVGGPTGGMRIIAVMHVAMFEAVNAIEPRYQPFNGDLKPKADASQDAAAASAAATVLAKLDPESAPKVKDALEKSLAGIPNGDAKDRGIKLGEESAAKVIELRLKDGNGTPNAFRPITQPGVYTETMVTAGWDFIRMTPFAMTSPDQFRPQPPVALTSEEWAKDYNEMKEIGEKNSTKRTPQQTENARFWLTVVPLSHQPLARQIVIAKNMSVLDSARFMSLVAMAATDALIAVFDAKYHYTFWRPITAIRNGDIDDNPATERVATWQPIDITPLHPEYPCAHCIVTGAVAGAITAMLGTEQVPEVVMTSPSAPGVTHKYTNVRDFNNEASEARIAAGFHWRFSTVVGSDMGWKIGANTVQNCMQPLKVATK
jgi:PAP2 superfamily